MKSTNNNTRTLALSSVLAVLAAVVVVAGSATAAQVALISMSDGTSFQNNVSTTSGTVNFTTTGLEVTEGGSYQTVTFSNLSESPDTIPFTVDTLNAGSVTVEAYDDSDTLITSKTASSTGTQALDVSGSSATSMYIVVSVADDSDGTSGETAVVSQLDILAMNDKPTADFVDSDNSATVETGVSTTLDASASSDPDSADTLSYAWDLDGDGQFDDATGATVSVAESSTGTYNYSVQVADGNGATDSATFTLDVTDSTSTSSGGSAGGSSLPTDPVIYIGGFLALAGAYLLLREA